MKHSEEYEKGYAQGYEDAMKNFCALFRITLGDYKEALDIKYQRNGSNGELN